MVVGDDVAAGIDDEAGAEGAALAAARAVIVAVTLPPWPPKKRLKKSCMSPWSPLAIVIAARSSAGADRAVRRDGVRVGWSNCLGKRLGVDVHDGGADLLDDLREAVGERDRGGDDEGRGVGGVEPAAAPCR